MKNAFCTYAWLYEICCFCMALFYLSFAHFSVWFLGPLNFEKEGDLTPRGGERLRKATTQHLTGLIRPHARPRELVWPGTMPAKTHVKTCQVSQVDHHFEKEGIYRQGVEGGRKWWQEVAYLPYFLSRVMTLVANITVLKLLTFQKSPTISPHFGSVTHRFHGQWTLIWCHFQQLRST